MKTWLLAAALLCAPNLLVAAEPGTKANTRVVRLGDLDLTQPQDRAILDARIIAAARGVCRSLGVGSPIERAGLVRCEREILAHARARAAVSIADARRRSQRAASVAAR